MTYENKINIYKNNADELKPYSIQSLILESLKRSFTSSQINIYDISQKKYPGVHFFLECTSDNATNNLRELLEINNNKIILSGKLNRWMQKLLNINILGNKFPFEEPKPANSLSPSVSNSNLKFNYKFNYLKQFKDVLKERPIWRFDFELEWNNSFSGNIIDKHEILNLSHYCSNNNNSNNVVYIMNSNEEKIPLIAEFFIDQNVLIWVNRNLSLIDLPEWKIIEEFISNGYFNKYPCIPYVSEFSSSENGLITMRLDCDEDIESARKIYTLYKRYNLPISLAITTNQIENKESISSLPREVYDYGGTILNHSHSHPINWGEKKDIISKEIELSTKLIKKAYNITTKYAVSPFHHLTIEAINILNQQNYKGVVAGICSSHHEFLIVKGGTINKELNILLHSQQCMVHGDCLTEKRSLDDYLNNFYYFSKIGYSVGFLDHPISKRYDYGWKEPQRQINTHKQIIEFLLFKNIKFISQREIFERLKAKDELNIDILKKDDAQDIFIKNDSKFYLSISIGGKRYDCKPLKITKLKVRKNLNLL